MLKYKSIIEKLTKTQKIALVTDLSALSDPSINRAGVPAVLQGDLAMLGKEWTDFLPYESVANSWDISLIEEMTEEIATVARGNNYKFLTTPDIKTATNAYQSGLSEDPFLSGMMGAAMLRGVHRAGAACALSSYALEQEDVEYLDLAENPRAVHELYQKPFLYAVEETPCDGVLASLKSAEEGYQSTNAALFGEAVGRTLGNDVLVYSKAASCLPDFHAFLKGCVSIGGGEVILDRALGRYEQMKSYCEAGSATELELQGSVEHGSAIDGETLDEAADRVIDFAFRVNRMMPEVRQVREDLGLRMAQESVVLLKNEGILPLAENTKIAVIGTDGGFAGACSGFEITGSALGYGEGAAQREAVQEAVRAAKSAKAVLLFLPPNESPKAKLQAESLALIEALSGTRKPVIAVLTGNLPVDTAFDRVVSAVLVVPQGSASCSAALESVLTGKYNPSGKLARSYPDYADEYYSVLKSDKEQSKTKVGTFVGYRYYDTIGRKVRYPFGHGLSYTSFSYSGLAIRKEEVCFTVKNTGHRAGCETAQLYLGCPCGSALRPKKELKGFVRVELAAGESRRVSIPLPRSRFASFDSATMGESIEKGVYRVYIGASVSDIRLKGSLLLDGEVRGKLGERPCDYFRDLSNIGKDYRLGTAEGRSSLPAKSKIRYSIFLGVLFATLLTAVILGTYLLRTNDTSTVKWVVLLVDLVLAIVSGILLLREKNYRKKKLQREISNQRLRFPQETASEKTPDIDPEKSEEKSGDDSPDEPHYFDKSLTYEVICRELQLFAQERGLYVGIRLVRTLISAMTASRILILSAKEKQLNLFCAILAEYFGTELYADNAENYVQADLYGAINTPFTAALHEATQDKTRIRLCLLRHVGKEWLENLSLAFGQAPELPRNLFLIMEDKEIFEIPTNILREAAILFFEAQEQEEREEKTAVRPMGNYQFENLCRNVREDFPLDERLWKRVDRLEEACDGERFSNRDWVRLEKHCSAYIACGGEEQDALDSAIATELLPTVSGMLKAGRTDDEVLALLEEIFNAQIGESRAYLEKQTRMSGESEI